MTAPRYSQHAFTLMEIAFVLLLSGIVAGIAVQLSQSTGTVECYTATKTQLAKVNEAIEHFAIDNHRYPMPARRNIGVESASYGREAVIGDLDKVPNADTSVAVFGALPFQALGIPVENASDCWGNKLSYVVTQSLTTTTGYLDPDTKGAIDIKTDTTNSVFLSGASYAVISHGVDGYGAVKSNYDSGITNNVASRKWCDSDASMRSQNCDVTNNQLIDTAYNDGKDAGNNYFDDVILYRGKRSINGVCGGGPNSCAAGTPTGYIDHGCDYNKEWTCVGSGSGTNATCTIANAACPPPPPPPPPPVVPPVVPPPVVPPVVPPPVVPPVVPTNTPVDCGWTDWSACDKPCNGGMQWRAPTNPTASNGGAACVGPGSQQCNMFACPKTPIDGVWSPWSQCDKPCGGGTQTRSCTPPSNGGAPCSGPASQSCNTQFCADPPPACGSSPNSCDVGSPGGYMEDGCGGSRWGCYSSTHFPAKCYDNWDRWGHSGNCTPH